MTKLIKIKINKKWKKIFKKNKMKTIFLYKLIIKTLNNLNRSKKMNKKKTQNFNMVKNKIMMKQMLNIMILMILITYSSVSNNFKKNYPKKILKASKKKHSKIINQAIFWKFILKIF